MPILTIELCGTDACTNEARFVVHWPGRRINMCPGCVGGAKKIAAAMGFDLDVDELPPRPPVIS